ncbi:MAG: translation elongation factor Ts [Dehalococcoidia bacterium]
MPVTISPDDIKKLREETQAGVMDCKRALEQAEGDFQKAKKILYDQGVMKMEKRADRESSQGVIESYIHQGRIGALVEVNTETDFVARNDAFRELARNVAMQVASMNPKYLSKEDVPADEVAPPEDVALLEMAFVREPSKSIQDLINDVRVKTGENVRIRRFTRFELGK